MHAQRCKRTCSIWIIAFFSRLGGTKKPSLLQRKFSIDCDNLFDIELVALCMSVHISIQYEYSECEMRSNFCYKHGRTDVFVCLSDGVNYLDANFFLFERIDSNRISWNWRSIVHICVFIRGINLRICALQIIPIFNQAWHVGKHIKYRCLKCAEWRIYVVNMITDWYTMLADPLASVRSPIVDVMFVSNKYHTAYLHHICRVRCHSMNNMRSYRF